MTKQVYIVKNKLENTCNNYEIGDRVIIEGKTATGEYVGCIRLSDEMQQIVKPEELKPETEFTELTYD